MKGKKKIVLIGLVTLLILSLAANAVLAVMLINEKNSDRYLYDPEYAIGGEDQTDPTDTPTEETQAPKTEIATEYITFTFPEEVKNQIAMETVEEEDSTEIIFTAKDYEEKLILFTVALSKTEPDGYVLGVLKDETKGDVYVAVNVHEQNPEDWSEAQYQEICTLQEQVNNIMVQVQEDPRFVSNR